MKHHRTRTFDPQIWDLVEERLSWGSPELNNEAQRRALAWIVQEAIEDFIEGAEQELAREAVND